MKSFNENIKYGFLEFLHGTLHTLHGLLHIIIPFNNLREPIEEKILFPIMYWIHKKL